MEGKKTAFTENSTTANYLRFANRKIRLPSPVST